MEIGVRNPTLAAIDNRRSLKHRFRTRKAIFLAWISLGHPSIAEILSASGVHALGLDIEHSTISLEQTQRLIAAAQSANVACLPRPTSWDRSSTIPILDSGADGLILPMVNEVSQIEEIASVMKYPPKGERSFGVNRAQGYGSDMLEYSESWNDDSVLIIQAEHPKSVANIEELVGHPEVDGVMLGPLDLSGRLGTLGDLKSPTVNAAIDNVVAACEQAGKSCGIQIPSTTRENVGSFLDRGINFVILESDLFTLERWARSTKILLNEIGKHA